MSKIEEETDNSEASSNINRLRVPLLKKSMTSMEPESIISSKKQASVHYNSSNNVVQKLQQS